MHDGDGARRGGHRGVHARCERSERCVLFGDRDALIGVTSGRAMLPLLFGTLAGCMPPYVANTGVPRDGTLYQASTGPLSYEAPTLRDAQQPVREVRGEACQYAIVLPLPTGVSATEPGASSEVVQLGVGWGDGGFARAMAAARTAAGKDVLFDVRADRHFSTVLWVYRRTCVEVHASAAPTRIADRPRAAAER